MYLTLTPCGGNLEGVRAASLSYFGHEPSTLTDAEQAMLIALPQAPEARRPDRRPNAAAARPPRRPPPAPAARRVALARMVQAGLISQDHAREAEAEALPHRSPFP